MTIDRFIVMPARAGIQFFSARNWIPACAGVTLALALSGCEGIGQGSTVQSLSVEAANGSTAVSPYPINACLRDQLVVIATFTDGTRADFSFRAAWQSSNPSVVQVSNNDIPTTLLNGGVFAEFAHIPYRPGTIIPRAPSGTATITASFLGLSASMDVQLSTPAFKIAPLVEGVDPQLQPPAPSYVGPGTTQRFAFFATQADGRTVTSANLNALGILNPVLWRLVGGELDPADSTDGADFDKYAMPSAAAPTTTIGATSGIVQGLAPDTTYQVEAVTSLCPDDSAFKPTAPVRVAAFASTSPLTLAHEADINGPGVAPTGDLIAGTPELMRVQANLDTDGDGAGDVVQDVSSQVDFTVAHTTACTSGTTNCTCDTNGANCTKRLFVPTGSVIQTLINNDGATADVVACFADLDILHADDCEEDAAGEDVALKSNTLSFRSVPVDLTGAGATLFARPDPAPAQLALAYPGLQFEAYGTFTALPAFTFAGGSATATQKITRLVVWTTRPQGSTTEFSDFAFVRNSGDGFFSPYGRFATARDVTANTVVDVFFAPVTPLNAVAAPTTPIPVTVCPSTGC